MAVQEYVVFFSCIYNRLCFLFLLGIDFLLSSIIVGNHTWSDPSFLKSVKMGFITQGIILESNQCVLEMKVYSPDTLHISFWSICYIVQFKLCLYWFPVWTMLSIILCGILLSPPITVYFFYCIFFFSTVSVCFVYILSLVLTAYILLYTLVEGPVLLGCNDLPCALW